MSEAFTSVLGGRRKERSLKNRREKQFELKLRN